MTLSEQCAASCRYFRQLDQSLPWLLIPLLSLPFSFTFTFAIMTLPSPSEDPGCRIQSCSQILQRADPV